MSPLPTLRTSEIPEFYTRENFSSLADFLRVQSLLLDFKHFERSFTTTGTNIKIKHNLGYLPKDLIQTSLIGNGSVTWNFGEFSNTELDLTLTGTISESNPTTIRFFIGTYKSS